MIQDGEISIVVQGPVLRESSFNITSETTRVICARLKKLFPKSELILSTWEGEDVGGILFDKLILSKDPGAIWFNYENYNLLNNCNRLIVSTKAGIEAASNKYVFKVRSDLFLMSKSFLKYFDKFSFYDANYKHVKSRIISFSIFSIKGHKTSLFTMERPYHISDWAYFGYKEDLLDLYSIPLTQEPEFSQWFLKRCKPFFDIEPWRLWKMPPEQYVTSSFLKKHTRVQLEHTTDLSNNNVENSARLLANNFLVLDQTQFSCISLKYVTLQFLFDDLIKDSAIFYETWLKDYHKFCNVCWNVKKLGEKMQIVGRRFFYIFLNRTLTIINKKNKLIQRVLANFIHKLI
ncbi:MAG: hypothetical protein H0U95_17740 [Bacteroidetes bacterium]|nr:hypothetical protein [Bacteroidota bacterium]